MNEKNSILIVDDSFLVRKFLSQVFKSMPFVSRVEAASDGDEAIKKALLHKPDLITLDVEMPGKSGVDVLKRLMVTQPTRVIMISSILPSDTEKAVAALRLGALDIITKPTGASYRDNQDLIRTELYARIRDILAIPVERVRYRRWHIHKEQYALELDLGNVEQALKTSFTNGITPQNSVPGKIITKHAPSESLRYGVIAVGASTGGAPAIEQLLSYVPADAPWPIIIAQHLPVGFTETFVKGLIRFSRLPIKVAQHGQKAVPGHVYLCPSGQDSRVVRIDGDLFFDIRISDVWDRRISPSIDTLFHSIAEVCGEKSIGVILSGMGKDGCFGLLEMRNAGAATIAQDEASSTVYGMPKEAEMIGAAVATMNIMLIGHAIRALMRAKDTKQ